MGVLHRITALRMGRVPGLPRPQAGRPMAAALPAVCLTLATIAPQVAARIRAVDEPGALGERLMELGLTPGTPLRVERRGHGGDLVQVAVRGAMLSLRRAQAQAITLDLDHEGGAVGRFA